MSVKTCSIGFILLYSCVWTSRLFAKPISSQDEKKAMGYFEKYNYMKPKDGRSPRTQKEITDGIKKFQRFAGIPMTGKVDNKTMEMVLLPRCGISDIGPSSIRRRRYAIQGTSWNKRELTYKVMGGPTMQISMSEVITEMRRAFNEWQSVTNLKFTNVDDPQADIQVRFGSAGHGDSYPFDGIGGTLAHGFYPHNNLGLSGDIHFDDDEIWVLGVNNPGTDFFWTALHEIGHSLGLDHSDSKDAIMYPFYTGFKENLALNEDDIKGIRYIYGTPVVDIQTMTPPTMMPSTTPYPLGIPDPCDTDFDAVFLGADDVAYFFTGKYYWTAVVNGERNGPFNVTDKWGKLPSSGIDAAYQLNGNITFFKGKNCWVYNGTEFIEGPIAISKKFMVDPSVDSIDAAFVWGANGKTYLFKDDMYWRYNEASNSLGVGYPVSINDSWVGIPNNIDAAMTWINGKTYFFKGRGFRIFDKNMAVVANFEPMLTNMYWMKCFNMESPSPTAGATVLYLSRMSQAFIAILLGIGGYL